MFSRLDYPDIPNLSRLNLDDIQPKLPNPRESWNTEVSWD